MMTFRKGRYQARIARHADDIRAAQQLRHSVFFKSDAGTKKAAPLSGGTCDSDPADRLCRHILIEDFATGRLVCCFRLMALNGRAQINQSYSSQFYDLSALATMPWTMAEIGRFCVDPAVRDADIVRVAWAAITRVVDHKGIGFLFGCTSFQGVNWKPYSDVFALLRQSYLAPAELRPGERAAEIHRFSGQCGGEPDIRSAVLNMPPLLRGYLGLGAWVSDHAVIDRQMDTLHVFTGLEIGRISPARVRALRAAAG